MTTGLALQLAALAALIPLAMSALTARLARNVLFWLLLGTPLVGILAVTCRLFKSGWQADFSANLWASIAVSLIAFGIVAAFNRSAIRLAALLVPYLFLLGLLAIFFSAGAEALPLRSSPAWFGTHVLLALAAYGIFTLGAIAGLSVFLQERALKRKKTGWAELALPPLADSESLQIRLLGWSALLMGAALVSGIANEFIEQGRFLAFTHKILLSFLGFILILGLLFLHFRTGLRGRQAARLILLAYLLVTLAYPGAKFVREFLID
jgi:ABC-type uncharacterized transport system permease subunit